MSILSQMQQKSFHIELIVDINRTQIEIFCPEIFENSIELPYSELNSILNNVKIDLYSPKRVVYSELLDNYEKTLMRLRELKNYTKTQKVKLLRKQNPNWRSLRFLNPITKFI